MKSSLITHCSLSLKPKNTKKDKFYFSSQWQNWQKVVPILFIKEEFLSRTETENLRGLRGKIVFFQYFLMIKTAYSKGNTKHYVQWPAIPAVLLHI